MWYDKCGPHLFHFLWAKLKKKLTVEASKMVLWLRTVTVHDAEDPLGGSQLYVSSGTLVTLF